MSIIMTMDSHRINIESIMYNYQNGQVQILTSSFQISDGSWKAVMSPKILTVGLI
jgi:hypothetical protein